ncbi:SRPBCC family protein [Streptomyces ovatisporus]|uniref:SRPBCC family protein n=1 Tax=Streptomyces ovatisporus TaxID=1128682 RepID=A0ABV9A6B9_9ACTN
MTPKPNGALDRTETGPDLVLTRTFQAPITDVWDSLTESERTARWFGPWAGSPGAGRTISVTMAAEEGSPEMQMKIEACEPPYHLSVSAVDEYGTWHLEAQLTEREGVTHLRFVQHLTDTSGVGETGPGWEYYLDRLTAAVRAEPMPEFDDYYPGMKGYYDALAKEAADHAPE